jgi:hypothetical protein
LLLDTWCTQKKSTSNPIQVILPNGQVISSTHTANLPFPQLPATAIQAHVFPHLHNQALLSVVLLCDAGCTVTFEQTSVKIRYEGNIVLEGMRVPPGLWTMNIPTPAQENATFSAPLKATALWHLHASLFSLATQTWTQAILNNHFATWPQFTVQEVRKHLPKSVATSMGHLDQQRQNIRSTKRKQKHKPTEDKEGINDTNLEKETPTPDSPTSLSSPIPPTNLIQI